MSKSTVEGKPVTILLVEDNQDHAELIKRSLKAHMVLNRLVHLSDGEVALDYLFRRGPFANSSDSPRPDIVLLDLRLPRIEGLEVLRQIKETKSLQHIPVVILTSSQDEGDIARAYHHHANSYLVKPLDFAKFSQMLYGLGFYWLAWNRAPVNG